MLKIKKRVKPLLVKSHGEALIAGVASLPTESGLFRAVSFSFSGGTAHHMALVWGNVSEKQSVLTRVHSECLTGDVFRSLRCDCYGQIQAAIFRISQEPSGIILYLRQEGRGIGLVDKVRAYALQDRGLDTIDANQVLGLPVDARCYDDAAAMLRAMRVDSIRLLTNNPDKVMQLREAGIDVTERMPHQLPSNKHNRNYLRTKALRVGHLLDPARVG
jgi:GTP cyclohydrolase II